MFKLAQTNSVALDEHFSPVPLPTLQQVIADLLDGKQIDLQAAGNAAVTPFLPGSGLPPGEMPPAIATALGFSFPTPAMDTLSPLGDLLSTLTTGLDGDLPTALTGLCTDFSALLTDSLGNLTSLF